VRDFEQKMILTESSFGLCLVGLVARGDFRSNLLRFLGQSQCAEAGHVGPDIDGLLCDLFEGLRALLGSKPFPDQSFFF